ncbi:MULTISPECIES: hypothetical protein [unclassified Meiothermus]|nr:MULTISPECIES: hypothetical protein [unclassified Meiothermus]
MLGLTDPRQALAFDLGLADHSMRWELEQGLGEFWWISILRAFTGK